MRNKNEFEGEPENNPDVNTILHFNHNSTHFPPFHSKLYQKCEKSEKSEEKCEKCGKSEQKMDKNDKSEEKTDQTIDEYSSAIFLNSGTDFEDDDATCDDSKEEFDKKSQKRINSEENWAQKETSNNNVILFQNLANFQLEYIHLEADSLIYHLNPIYGHQEIHKILIKSRKYWGDIPNNSIIDRILKKRKSLTDIFSASNGNTKLISKSKSKDVLESEKLKENSNQLKAIKNPLFHKFVPT